MIRVKVLAQQNLRVKISPQKSLNVKISPQKSLNVKVGGEFYKVGDYEIYDGTYEVSPTFELQTLKTKDNAMKENIDIKPISITETPNPSGGFTVIIGG